MFRNLLAYSTIYFCRPKSIRRFNLINKAQYWNEDILFKYKENLLAKVLEYSYKHVPYYNHTLEPYTKCWRGSKFRWDIFNEIPVLEKEVLKNNFSSFHSDEISKLKTRENRSGGSTGVPTKHLQDEHFRQMDMAEDLLFKKWGGIKPGDRSLFVAADERDYFGMKVDWRKYVTNFLFNKNYFNLFKLTENQCFELVRMINKLKPKYIQIYTSAAHELSQFILRNNLRVYSPKMIMCIAGTIYNQMLDIVERAFKSKAYSVYGSRETGAMAGFCRQRIYHEMSLSHHLDIVDSYGKSVKEGESGNMAVTVLSNKAMPLIKYKIGDMGMWGERKCSCGCNFRPIKKILGRTGEVFYNSKGKIILPEIFIHLVGVVLGELSDEISRYQICQLTLKQLEVKLVVKEKPSLEFHEKLKYLRSRIKQVMEDDVRVDINFVDDIPTLASGKYCYTISHIKEKI